MCTVTYLPSANGFYLTSNRDEKSTRPAALPPAVYFLNGSKIIYPKDAQGCGTWIALKIIQMHCARRKKTSATYSNIIGRFAAIIAGR